MAEALARITKLTDLGMIQIRADLDRAGDAIAGAAESVGGAAENIGDAARDAVPAN